MLAVLPPTCLVAHVRERPDMDDRIWGGDNRRRNGQDEDLKCMLTTNLDLIDILRREQEFFSITNIIY